MAKFSNNAEINIFEKDNQFGVLAIDYLTDVDILGSSDSSTSRIISVPYLDTRLADQKYRETKEKNFINKWKVIYIGNRNWG